MMDEDKKIYTTLSLEEMVWNLKVLIVLINSGSGEIVDLRSVVSKLEALVGQKLMDGGYWCPPSCTPTADEVEQMTEDKRREEAEQRDASLSEW